MKKVTAIAFLLVFIISAAYAEETSEIKFIYNVTPETFNDCTLYVSPLDQYGRAGTAFAVLSKSSVDSERRQDISMFSPVGYVSGSFYHRCHLIGAQLTSGTACLENLITGTEHLNLQGMLPVENRVRSYIMATGDHVLYRVSPIYQGAELLPRAVEMTAYSIESDGLRITAYCYNIEPGYDIDYASGAFAQDGTLVLITDDTAELPTTRTRKEPDYILNVKSHKFHYPWCIGVESMSEKNKQEFYGTRQEAINQGYSPCGSCNP